MIKILPIQTGNNLIKLLKKSSWHFDPLISADYEINSFIGVVFISIRFHICKSEYIRSRLRKVNKKYKKQILMLLVDIKDINVPVEEFLEISLEFDFTLIICYSYEECAKFISELDTNSFRNIEVIRPKKSDGADRFLSSFPKLNKNDVDSIKNSFNSLKGLVNSERGFLENIEGIGKSKLELLEKYFDMPFKK